MRLPVLKTLKLYVAGAFIRSESGQVARIASRQGTPMNVSRASRKDIRDAVEHARSAQAKWAARSSYNRGQILYRLAEMLESRADGLPAEAADRDAAIDRAVHHAGWCDKVTALMSALNPVSQSFVNYSQVRPVGVVIAVPDPADGLTGLVEAVCAPLVMGNAALLLVSTEQGELAVALAEAIATSDVPAGVVGILTGDVREMLGHACKQDDVDCIYAAAGALDGELREAIEREGALVLRRLLVVDCARSPATPNQLVQLAEIQTVWMSR